MKRAYLLGSVMTAALISSGALADDLTINSDTKTAVKTSTAANNSAGNITIGTTGTISLTSGAAITLDSNNTVINSGGIINSGASNAIGIHVLGGVTGSVSGSGYIDMSGGTDGPNFGILLDGAGTFTGDILMQNGAGIAVRGANSAGIVIRSAITGNLTNGAAIGAIGAGANGIVTSAAISGAVSNYGTVGVSGTITNNQTQIDPEGGWGIAIGASVGGGLINGGPFDVTDTVNTTASVSTVGSKPAYYISPIVAGSSAANMTIGIFTDPVTPGYSFLNRGNITATGNDPGVHAKALRIEGDATHTVTFTGGLYNRGTIRSSSTGDALTASLVGSAAVDSTAFAIGARASAPLLTNEGSIQATLLGPKGGTAIGLSIESNASLPTLSNSGSIAALAVNSDTAFTGTLAAYGIRDRSGTLTSITNSGTISGGATKLNNNSQLGVAIDLSTTAAPVTITDSGTIGGDVIFGTGGGTLTINGTSALVTGGVRAAGGALAINLTQGTLQTTNARAATLTVGSAGTVAFVLNQSTPSTPIISTTGATSFASGAKLQLTPNSFLTTTGTYTLLNAAGGLSFADFAAASTQPLPFLFNGSYSRNAQNLFVTLNRKTATQLGLTGNAAIMYEPVSAAALTDADLGAALLTLTNSADVTTALNSLLPDLNDGTRVMTDVVTSQATGPVAGRQRAMMTALSERTGVGFWGQEFYNFADQDTDAFGPGFYTSGQGAVLGAEWGDLASGRWGMSYTFYTGHATEKNPRQLKSDASINLLTLYSGWRLGEVFFSPQVSAGLADFSSKRTVTVGASARTLTANWTGYIASGSIMSGIVIDLGGFYLIPQISLDGTFLRQTGRTEMGGTGANLIIDSQTQKTVRAFIGVAAEGSYTFDDGDFRPQFLAGYTRDLVKDDPVIDASFQAVPGSPMALVGRPIEDSQLVGAASFSYVMRNWSAGFNYDASSREGALAQSATISLTSRF